MSGHSKWNNIKNKKAASDAKKSKAFTIAAKLIRTAVRQSGNGDPASNPALRMALDKAREVNMPNENVQRAINRGLGKGDAGSLEEITYEGYGPGGVGFLAVARTDNKQRTGAEIRFIFDRNGGSLGGPGSTMYLFRREGGEYATQIPVEVEDPEVLQQLRSFRDALEEHDDVESVYCNTNLDEESESE